MTTDLLTLLAARAAAERPLRVGLIGVGKFSTMFLAQVRRVKGLHLLGVADPAPQRARAALLRTGWPDEQFQAASLSEALATGATHVGDDAAALIAAQGLEVVVEASDTPAAGIAHCLLAIDYGRHIVMVNVEADALAGPILARRAAEAGVVYSLAYGDRPALIVELVEWARACGFEVVCAGRGSDYLPVAPNSTPETAWERDDRSSEQTAAGDFNPQILNSLIERTRTAIEMAAVANACGLTPQPDGLRFPPCGIDELPNVCRPEADGGALAHSGTVEVLSGLRRDSSAVERELRRGVYVSFAAPNAYAARCLADLGLPTDSTGRYSALYRPYHLAGLELTVSVLRVGLRGEPTGRPTAFHGDVVAVATRNLSVGERLDGEGRSMVYGLLRPAARSLAAGLLPIGLAHGIAMRRAVVAGQALTWDDVLYEPNNPTVRMRKLMERTFAAGGG